MQVAVSKTKSINNVEEPGLHRCLSAFDLTLLGIGAIVGAGIFVITGIAAATKAGPGIIYSYILAGSACVFCACAYAELASSIGGCGSAYGYAYAGIGKLAGWIIGWYLLLEYGMNAATISIGWAGYLDHSLVAMGFTLPKWLTNNPFQGGIINLPAVLIIIALASVLSIGTKHSSQLNNIMVYIKLAVIGLFIGIGAFHFDSAKWENFLPFGYQGIVNGAGLIFFAFIGFDTVSTAGDEAKNPKRDLPIGIIASLIICTFIYMLVAGILTGIVHYPELNSSSPVAGALLKYGHTYSAELIAFGALAGLTTAVLAMYYGFTRVFLAMARDGFLPDNVTKIHEKSGTPRRLIWGSCVVIAFAAGFFPITEIANLVNIGTLSAFVAVCSCVIVMRYTKPDLPRPFRMPLSPFFPLMGIGLCFYLMSTLPMKTWISFLIWTTMGLILYYIYSLPNHLKKMAR